MATRPKRKMKYPPGSAFADPLGYVLDSIKPASQAEDGKWLLECKMKNHSAVTEFVHGRGTKGSLTAILQMHNMARALLLNGFGVDLTNIILDSDKAIDGQWNGQTDVVGWCPKPKIPKWMKEMM